MTGRKYRKAAEACQLLLRQKVDNMLARIAPWRCILCDGSAAGMDLCVSCLEGLPWLPLEGGPPARTDVTAALDYQSPVDSLITGLKFQGRVELSRVLGELLAIRVQENGCVSRSEASTPAVRLPDALVPVPLHRRRMLQRGYNQAGLIASTVGLTLGIPVRPGWLQRERATVPQTELDRAARLRGPANAFRVPPRFARDCAGAHLALVDDVLTTGATLSACADALHAAGASRVERWAVARVASGSAT